MDAQAVVWFVIAAVAAGMAMRLLYQRYISKQASAVQSRGGTTLFAIVDGHDGFTDLPPFDDVQVDYGGGRRRIVLDNGQAWMLAESASAGPLRQGDDVRIRKGLMGGYLLTTPAGVSLRVRRTR